MTAPGITVTTAVATPPPIPNVATATWFVTGLAQRGPVGTPISLQSMADFTTKLGSRAGYTALYDALDLFFHDGGLLAMVSRVVGPSAAPASVFLKDSATTPLNTIKVSANSPGTWGNALTVQVVAGTLAGTYQLVIAYNGVTVEQSPNLASPADAQNWSSLSNFIVVVDQANATAAPTNNPAVVAATPLANGLDDNASIAEGTWTAALNAFPPDLGPGQVSAPGRTTDAAHVALMAHASACNRIALLDGVDTPTAATLISAATAAIAGGDGSRGCIVAPWVTIPGIPTGTGIPAPSRVAPPSALAAAAIARSDAQTLNPNVAAAGSTAGASSFAIGVSQTYVAADRGNLNAAGINVIRNIASVVQLYGFRSMSIDPQFTQLNWCRLHMAIQDEGQKIAAEIAQFSAIDAKGQLLGRLNGHLAGMLQRFWQIGALFGTSATDAFKVDTSSAVNTVQTAAAGQVLAVLSIRQSAMSEFTRISIINVPLTQSV